MQDHLDPPLQLALLKRLSTDRQAEHDGPNEVGCQRETLATSRLVENLQPIPIFWEVRLVASIDSSDQFVKRDRGDRVSSAIRHVLQNRFPLGPSNPSALDVGGNLQIEDEFPPPQARH